MKSQVLSSFEITWLPAVGMLIFFIFFILAFFWVYRPGSKETYQNHAKSILNNEEKRG